MRLLALFLSCLVAGSLACSDDQCKNPNLRKELEDVKFMPNEEELRQLCPKIISFLECEKEFLECPGKTLQELTVSSNQNDAKTAEAMIGGERLVRELCDEDSSLHYDYVESVECFRGFAETAVRYCREYFMAPEIEDIFPPNLDNKEINDEFYKDLMCLRDALEAGCVIDTLGESCGEVAQRTAMNFMGRMGEMAGKCEGVKNAEDLKEQLLDFLELPDNERKEIFYLLIRRR